MAFKLWQRSKQGYEELKECGFIKLPSGRLLRYIKNKVKQTPGFNKEMLEWMVKAAQQKKVSDAGKSGYIVFDEMSIQGDIQLRRNGDSFELAGLVNLGEFHQNINILQTGEDRMEMASHILQFSFVGIEGFEWPIGYFPTAEIDPVTLQHIYWEGVWALSEHGFETFMAVCDGAQCNRSFILNHFGSTDAAISADFVCTNPCTGLPHVFMMDPSHNFKKLRNNVEKSKKSGDGTRLLKKDGKYIFWSHWVSSYQRDVVNLVRVFPKLTDEHFQLTPGSRMRNHLAFDVLGERMLELMMTEKQCLGNGELDASIQFLETTKILIKNFTSKAPIRSLDDSRFVENTSALQWFKDWHENVKCTQGLTAMQRNRMFISEKTMFDVASMVIGFKSYCSILFSQYPGCEIKPSRTNQDGQELFFGRQRAQEGQNENPTELSYGANINAIVRMSNFAVRNGNC